MAYIVTKTIKGRDYRYLQRSYRDGGRVRTQSVYLGPANGEPRRKNLLARIGEVIALNLQPPEVGEATLARFAAAPPQVHKDRDAKRNQVLAEMYVKYGMRVDPGNPVPIDKPVPYDPAYLASLSVAAPPAAPQEDAPSDKADGAVAGPKAQ